MAVLRQAACRAVTAVLADLSALMPLGINGAEPEGGISKLSIVFAAVPGSISPMVAYWR